VVAEEVNDGHGAFVYRDIWNVRLRGEGRGIVDFLSKDDVEYIEPALRECFARFDLELHPEKTGVISFGRYERENAKRQNRRANSFDFLGFTHYCGTSRKGKFIFGRKTSRRKFRKKCKEMNDWLRKIRNFKKTKEWWPFLLTANIRQYNYSSDKKSTSASSE